MARVSEVSRRLNLLRRGVFSSRLGRVPVIVVILIGLIIIGLIATLRIIRQPIEIEPAAPETIAGGPGEEKESRGEPLSPAAAPLKPKVPTERMTFDELMKFVDAPLRGKDIGDIRAMRRTRAITPEEFEEWKSKYDVIRQMVISYIDSAEPEEIDRIWWDLLRDSPEPIELLKLRQLPLHLAYLEHAIDPAAFGYNAGWESAWHSAQCIIDAFTALNMKDEFEAWAKKFTEELDAALASAAAKREEGGGGLGVYAILMLPARARIHEAFGEEVANKVKLDTIDYLIAQLPEVDIDKLHRARMIVDEVAKLSREIGSYDRAIQAVDVALPMFESLLERAQLRSQQANLWEESGHEEKADQVRATAISELAMLVEQGETRGRGEEVQLLAHLCEAAERYEQAINYYERWFAHVSTSPRFVPVDESGKVVREETVGQREYIEARTRIAKKLLTEEQAALFEKSRENIWELRKPLKFYFDRHQKMPDDLDELVEAGYVEDPSILVDPVTGQLYKYTSGLGRWDDAIIFRSEPKHGLATTLNLTKGTRVIWVGESSEDAK